MPNEQQADQQADPGQLPRRSGAGCSFALAALVFFIGLAVFIWAYSSYSFLLSQYNWHKAELQLLNRKLARKSDYMSHPGSLPMMRPADEWEIRQEAQRTKLEWESQGPFLYHIRRLGMGIMGVSALFVSIGVFRSPTRRSKPNLSGGRVLGGEPKSQPNFDFLEGDSTNS